MDGEVRIRRNDRVVYRDLEEGGVLLDLRSGRYFSLNPVGALIWRLLEEGPTIEELAGRVRNATSDVPALVEVQVSRFVHGLADEDLVELQQP